MDNSIFMYNKTNHEKSEFGNLIFKEKIIFNLLNSFKAFGVEISFFIF